MTEEKGLEGAIRELKRKSPDVMRELRRRRRNGPKPSEKRRNKRWFSPQTAAVLMHSGEYRTRR